MNVYYNNRYLKSRAENLACPCCDKTNPNPEFQVLMRKIEAIRDELEFYLPIVSAYRCVSHPMEAGKSVPGPHSIAAVHVNVNQDRAFQLVMEALRKGISGIGINQWGPMDQRYIHLDLRDKKSIWIIRSSH